MVAPPITEDYYAVLEVPQTATANTITQSYRRLALKLHPDRNPAPNATDAFQMVWQLFSTKQKAILSLY